MPLPINEHQFNTELDQTNLNVQNITSDIEAAGTGLKARVLALENRPTQSGGGGLETDAIRDHKTELTEINTHYLVSTANADANQTASIAMRDGVVRVTDYLNNFADKTVKLKVQYEINPTAGLNTSGNNFDLGIDDLAYMVRYSASNLIIGDDNVSGFGDPTTQGAFYDRTLGYWVWVDTINPNGAQTVFPFEDSSGNKVTASSGPLLIEVFRFYNYISLTCAGVTGTVRNRNVTELPKRFTGDANIQDMTVWHTPTDDRFDEDESEAFLPETQTNENSVTFDMDTNGDDLLIQSDYGYLTYYNFRTKSGGNINIDGTYTIKTSDMIDNNTVDLSSVDASIEDINTDISQIRESEWTLAAMVQYQDDQTIARTMVYNMPETFAALYVEKPTGQGINLIYGKTTSTDTYIHGEVTVMRNDLGTSTLFDSTNIERYVMARNAFASTHENTLITNLVNYNSADITLTVNREWDTVDGQIVRDIAYMYHFRISRAYGGQSAYDDRYAIFVKKEKIVIDNQHQFIQGV